jgi:regulator of protease activity HflC (stomatin/prohibitin superfamily)
MSAKVFRMDGGPTGSGGIRVAVIAIVVLVLFALANPIKVIPAGHVGVKDFFGVVSKSVLSPGVHLVFPLTRVVRMTTQTQQIKETAEVPSQEGLIMDLEVSLLFRLEPSKAAEIYRTVGRDYQGTVVEPQIRSAIREITATYDAKALYSSTREKIAQEVSAHFAKLTTDRGIVTESVLLRKVGLPTIVANAIQEKLRREQEAEQMKFVLQKEQQEAERKRIEAHGIADFQRIVAAGISTQLLEWKGIEATEKLAASANAKVVIVGAGKDGLPVILDTR